MKQCKFYDKENDVFHGGILDDSGNIICGCCGGLIEADEIGDGDDCTHKIIEIYDEWRNLDTTICGEILNREFTEILTKENLEEIFLNPQNYVDESFDKALFKVHEKSGDSFIVLLGTDSNDSFYLTAEDSETAESFYPEEGETLSNVCDRILREWKNEIGEI